VSLWLTVLGDDTVSVSLKVGEAQMSGPALELPSPPPMAASTAASSLAVEQQQQQHQQQTAVHASSSSSTGARDAFLARAFLDASPSQLTYAGLAALHSGLREGQLAVLFRNNHFNVVAKKDDAIFILVTDQVGGWVGLLL
jgi:hypothetical protein